MVGTGTFGAASYRLSYRGWPRFGGWPVVRISRGLQLPDCLIWHHFRTGIRLFDGFASRKLNLRTLSAGYLQLKPISSGTTEIFSDYAIQRDPADMNWRGLAALRLTALWHLIVGKTVGKRCQGPTPRG